MRLLTAGESHGPGLTAIIEGLPAGLRVTADAIDVDLGRRQQGYGRGGRMRIEQDAVELRSGVRLGKTTGAPVAMLVGNRDYDNWREAMQPEPASDEQAVPDIALFRPRPGHADLAGAQKLLTHDVRNVLERASARHTTMRVAAGSVAKRLLDVLGIRVVGHVLAIGGVSSEPQRDDLATLAARAEASEVRCADAVASRAMMARIDETRRAGDSLGGLVEVLAVGVPPGLGHFSEWDRRLDGRLAQAVMSVPAIKAVEIGDGFAAAALPGSRVHDPIEYDAEGRRFRRPTNHAGGIEGGMSNGEPVVVRAAMKPIPTLARPLASVDLRDHSIVDAGKERTDAVAVPACAVVCEAVVAWELACAVMERFGGDTIEELEERVRRYREALAAL
ncbi:MAG: chorismate synthase [Myxococcota bacterium]